MDAEKLFHDVESNNSQEYEETKKKLAEFFNQTKEQWLVQGMMDYYLTTSSNRIIEVLVKVQSPHDNYIFERLSDWIRGQHHRIHALTLFNFIIRKHPTWLYKVAKHRLIKDILKLLQTEKEIIPLMTALLCIITLLPIIPSLVPNFLPDLFEVFGHLASWNCQNPNKLTSVQLIHLQIGLCKLFHLLYGMFPCNFVSYLREFIVREKGAIFQHTIKPLLETVRMHPMLVTYTRETEINVARWKEMEPHDVVVDCAKLSLDYYQDNSECIAGIACRAQESLFENSNLHIQMPSLLQNYVNSPFHSLMCPGRQTDFQKFESIWSPSIEILSTPPPTGTVPHTPTPNYNVPMLTAPNTVMGGSGTSPPEAAVEATPETTPLKDITMKRVISSNSPAVRALLGTSQPSSPMRKEQSPFNFPDPLFSQMSSTSTLEQTATSLSSQRMIQIINERNQAQMYQSNSEDAYQSTMTTVALQELQFSNTANFLKSDLLSSLDSPTNPTVSTQDDLEVTELTSQQIGPHHSDTLQDISVDDDETERSPCSAGGLHVPTSKSMRILARRINRNRFPSYCHNDNSNYLSYGTSPADVYLPFGKIRRIKSWPAIPKHPSFDEGIQIEPGEICPQPGPITQTNGDSSSPSGDDAISAATHFKKLQQKRDKKVIQHPLGVVGVNLCATNNSCGTQTIQQWPPIYEYNLLELFVEDNKLRTKSSNLQPYNILDQSIELTIKIKQNVDVKNREELLRDQIQLLHFQLQYERYRREIHAERNRRLLGKSRAIRSLEMDNDRLKDQLTKLQNEVQTLTFQLNKSRRNFNGKEQDLMKESNIWKTKYNSELEDNKQLRATIDILQRRLNNEIQSRKETNTEIEVLRGDIFDMRNDMQQAEYQAKLGNQYKHDLSRLQSELLVMGEIQIKCRDKLAEVENLKATEEELIQLQESYNDEISELRNSLEIKSAQLETAKFRLSELQVQLTNKEAMFTDQKRLLKSAKEEYQEKFNALEKKYTAQKSIVLQLEERILELYKNQTAVNLSMLSPDSDKTDIAGSIDYNSPLSISLASSEGLSASLRSVTEFRNLQALVQPNPNANAQISVTSIKSNIGQQQNIIRRESSSQHNYQQTTTATTSSVKSVIGHKVKMQSVTTSSSSPNPSIPPSSTTSSTRQSATSLDIPTPGTSQHRPSNRHHYTSHHR